MSKKRTIFIIGIWIAILPFLGFPSSWKTLFLFLTGAGLVYLSYSMNIEKPSNSKNSIYKDPYEENKGTISDEIKKTDQK